MSESFLGQIRLMGSYRPPRRGALCDGRVIGVEQNAAQFSVLRYTYGGNGRINFALPDMRGRNPVLRGVGCKLSSRAGSEYVSLTTDEMPAHRHAFYASANNGIRLFRVSTFLLIWQEFMSSFSVSLWRACFLQEVNNT